MQKIVILITPPPLLPFSELGSECQQPGERSVLITTDDNYNIGKDARNETWQQLTSQLNKLKHGEVNTWHRITGRRESSPSFKKSNRNSNHKISQHSDCAFGTELTNNFFVALSNNMNGRLHSSNRNDVFLTLLTNEGPETMHQQCRTNGGEKSIFLHPNRRNKTYIFRYW